MGQKNIMFSWELPHNSSEERKPYDFILKPIYKKSN